MHLSKYWISTEEESSKMIPILYAWNFMSAGVSFHCWNIQRSNYHTWKERSYRRFKRFYKLWYYWVKGHQDDNTPTEELSIVAQLNVEVDILTGEFQKYHGEFRPLIKILPSCLAMLSIRRISITSNYNKQFVKAYVKPRYIRYLQEKYNWSDSVVQLIVWECLTLSLQRINRDVVAYDHISFQWFE